MFANTVTASACAENGAGRQAPMAQFRSRRASSSRLIAEISASTACTCSLRRSRARTAATRSAGTYRNLPRPCGRGDRYTYGPCGSPSAQRQSGLPQRRAQYPLPGPPQLLGRDRFVDIHRRLLICQSRHCAPCWVPSPCGRLSRPRTTTGPPPRPTAPGRRWTLPPAGPGWAN
jgi:hypothetical protein